MERMALAIDERRRPIQISALKWSSGAGPWAGFPVECHVLGPRGTLREFGIDYALLGLCVNGRGTLQVNDGGTTRRMQSTPGRFTLLGRGFEQRPLAWSGTREMLYVALRPAQLEHLMSQERSVARLRVEPQYTIEDPQVVAIVSNMRDEVRAGCPAGRLYAEALSLSLAAYLLGRYSHEGVPAGPRGVSLSAEQIRRIDGYVEANLGNDIGLAGLAAQVGLSPHYFSLLFKRSFGVSPYRYIVTRRIEQARRRLADRAVPIAEIALGLGFADQSHFCRVFKAFFGTTPKRYRADH